jgi:hypothetical protein
MLANLPKPGDLRSTVLAFRTNRYRPVLPGSILMTNSGGAATNGARLTGSVRIYVTEIPLLTCVQYRL